MLAKDYTDFGTGLAFVGWSGAAWGTRPTESNFYRRFLKD
jgi:hypothetical protein